MQNRFICLLKKEKKREGEREKERERERGRREREGGGKRMCVDANVTDFYSNANECVRPKIVGLPNC
jgi:hypothetical protein